MRRSDRFFEIRAQKRPPQRREMTRRENDKATTTATTKDKRRSFRIYLSAEQSECHLFGPPLGLGGRRHAARRNDSLSTPPPPRSNQQTCLESFARVFATPINHLGSFAAKKRPVSLACFATRARTTRFVCWAVTNQPPSLVPSLKIYGTYISKDRKMRKRSNSAAITPFGPRTTGQRNGKWTWRWHGACLARPS